jgi:protocatechuate 3,4-dioxygenase alpha subunit
MEALKQTPSQTVGPYYAMRLARPGENELAPLTETPRIRISGSVYDGAGVAIEDALIEVWQANRGGRYFHPEDDRAAPEIEPGFTGFGRAAVDLGTREYRFETVKPGRVPAPDGSLQAPHLSIVVQGRGMLCPVFTRLYFPDEVRANDEDFVLRKVPEARRHTLISSLLPGESGNVYHFDVRFQGPAETVFFAFEG